MNGAIGIPVWICVWRILDDIGHIIQRALLAVELAEEFVHHIDATSHATARPDLAVCDPSRLRDPIDVLAVRGDPRPAALVRRRFLAVEEAGACEMGDAKGDAEKVLCAVEAGVEKVLDDRAVTECGVEDAGAPGDDDDVEVWCVAEGVGCEHGAADDLVVAGAEMSGIAGVDGTGFVGDCGEVHGEEDGHLGDPFQWTPDVEAFETVEDDIADGYRPVPVDSLLLCNVQTGSQRRGEERPEEQGFQNLRDQHFDIQLGS